MLRRTSDPVKVNFDTDTATFSAYNSDSDDEITQTTPAQSEEKAEEATLSKDEQEIFERMKALYRKDCTINVPLFNALELEPEPFVGISVPVADLV